MDADSAESRDHLRQLEAIDDEINSLEQSESIQESIRVLKTRRNALAPISRLPPETLATVFSFLRPFANEYPFIFSLVCRQWRETALNYPRIWSHISLYLVAKLSPAAIAEILVRAKTVPLHLDLYFTKIRASPEHNVAIVRQIDAHISHTRHLRLCGYLPPLESLVSSAPILESLSLFNTVLPQVAIPPNLFNCTTPGLTSLEFERCDISWESPLLKGLRDLEIRWPSQEARPQLEAWLDALDEMPQLELLVLEHATPSATAAPMSEPLRTVTLPSLTNFLIFASAKDCALALAHLVMPACASLQVHVECREIDGRYMEGGDMGRLIPYVARNVYGPQGTEQLRSLLISGKEIQAHVVAWTMPNADLNSSIFFNHLNPVFNTSIPARLVFTANDSWNIHVHTEIFEYVMLLPVDSISTLTAEEDTGVSKEFWFNHAQRWASLEQACLHRTAVKAFRDMLAEDAPPDGPRLPLLRKLILVDVTLTALRTFSLRDVLIKRVKQGVPLGVLDLRQCVAPERAIQLLREVVIDVKEPLSRDQMEEVDDIANWDPEVFNLRTEIGSLNEVEFEDDWGPQAAVWID